MVTLLTTSITDPNQEIVSDGLKRTRKASSTDAGTLAR